VNDALTPEADAEMRWLVGMSFIKDDDLVAAAAALSDSAEKGRALGLDELAARCDLALARGVHIPSGRYDEGLACAERACAFYEKMPDWGNAADCLLSVAIAHEYTGKLSMAEADYIAAYRAAERCGSIEKTAFVDRLHGNFLRKTGQLDESEAILDRGLAAGRSLESFEHEADFELELGLTYELQGRLPEASAAYGRAREGFEARGELENIADCDLNLGNVFYAAKAQANEADELVNAAEEYYLRARAAYDRLGFTYKRALAARNLARVYRETARLTSAASLYREARADFEQINAQEDIADCDRNLGTTLLMSGELNAGEELVARARDSFHAMQLTDKVDGCEKLLAIVARQRSGNP
jgi:tetratricopeptide (TPR) repeat protein